MNKQQILDMLDALTDQQIAEYIVDGKITFGNIKAEGIAKKRQDNIKSIIGEINSQEDNDWLQAKGTNTEASYCDYLAKYSDGKYRQKAIDAIKKIDENDWAHAQSTSNYDAYIQQHPKGMHIVEAKHAKDNCGAFEEAWRAVDKDDIRALRKFIADYPQNPHLQEAKRLINTIMTHPDPSINDILNAIKNEKDRNAKENIIVNYLIYCDKNKKEKHYKLFFDAMRQNHNILPSGVIKNLIDKQLIDASDLLEIGIDSSFIKCLGSEWNDTIFDTPKPLTEISRLSTEVYFWGMPSSGKSCAIGSILKAIQSGKYVTPTPDIHCQGFDYYSKLANVFSTDSIIKFPMRTPTDITYEIGIDLREAKDRNKYYPITIIDLAGEMFKCMHKTLIGKSLGGAEQKALDTLNNILLNKVTKNQKIHFFVIEYGAENMKYEDVYPRTYLESSIQYIREKGILKNATNAIYILVTKADLANKNNAELGAHLKDYIQDNYKAFYDGLVDICKKFEINRGKVGCIPYTLGDVCFQDFCKVDESPAVTIINEILSNSKKFGESKFDKFKNIFRK